MEILSEAMNVYSPALEVLRAQGFCLFGEFDCDDETKAWIAERPDVRLSAGTPIALLGLAMLWQQRGVDWAKGNGSRLYDRLLDGERILPLQPT